MGGGSPQLAGMIAIVAGKALAVLADKAEMMAASGPEVRALGVAATPAQVGGARCLQGSAVLLEYVDGGVPWDWQQT